MTDDSEITQSDVNQAIEAIRQRADTSGVAEAEIGSQGDKDIIANLPGRPSEQILRLVRTSAVMRIRPMLTIADDVGSPTPTRVANIDKQQKEAQKSASPSANVSPSISPSPSTSVTPAPDPKVAYDTEELKKVAREKTNENHDDKISDQPKSKSANASDADN